MHLYNLLFISKLILRDEEQHLTDILEVLSLFNCTACLGKRKDCLNDLDRSNENKEDGKY